MQANRRGNPRTPRTGNFGQNRRPSQGAVGDDVTDHTPANHDTFLGGFGHSRSSSSSSDQSNWRNRSSNNFSSNNEYRRNRGHQSNWRDTRQNNSHTRYHSENSREQISQNLLRSKKERNVDVNVLESLLEKDSEEIIMELSNANRGIIEYIQSNSSEDALVLFVKILKKVSDSSFEQTKYTVLQKCLDQDFVQQLVSYILHLPLSDQKSNRQFWSDPDGFWNNITDLCQHIFDSLPTFSRNVLPELLKSLVVTFPNFEMQHNAQIPGEVKDSLTKLNETVREAEEEQKKLKVEDEGEPPDDFRMISVYPTAMELRAGGKPFLRKNVLDGPYRDVDHYLDVQFRLLREDFVGPLRSAISTYRTENQMNKKIENVRIYERVRFLNPETVNHQYCIRLQFASIKQRKNFNYENSKNFMIGSLLVFTCDNFQTFLFGKVAGRKLEDLVFGELIVGFDESTNVQYNTDYLMVECSIYFEPYYHVLNALQSMSFAIFPMEKYIIDVDSSVQAPEYLSCLPEFYDWSQLDLDQLNESQREAFKAALTQEFCIIQGPPGTGKTHLGLKIAKTLLENEEIWYNDTPMLVICYTNHALDQFLEGLIPYTERILRVGGQSKSEALEKFNLRNSGTCRGKPFRKMREKVKKTLIKISDVTKKLQLIDMYDSVEEFDVFVDLVKDYNNSWFYKTTGNAILEWLFNKQVEADPDVDFNEVEAAEVNIFGIREARYFLEETQESDDDDYFEVDDLYYFEVDDLFAEVRRINTEYASSPLISLSSLESRIEHLQNKLIRRDQTTNVTLAEERKCIFELDKLRLQHEYLKAKLLEGKQRATTKREPPRFVNLTNPHTMPPEARWDLYFYCLDLYKNKLKRQLDFLNQKFREIYTIYEEMRDIENLAEMKRALVVGMTTTGAARLRSSVQALRSPIVIVEEAAEVLEAHIVAALTRNCQHLILLGDHQQLKPSTANYSVEKFYNLGISLFERMVLNKIQLFTLNVQHRMRPEISSLISPTIYPDLEDHESVSERPMIRGVDNCLFFLDHQHEEDNSEGTSKKNYHEIEFLINYARHLILNGYKSENITILAAYLGQMYEMQKETMKRFVLRGVRVAVLDNYQGEECDIILLSLVRNNKENRIGFLSIENRVCVALSRARNGFYIMGNMTQLCAASELWRNIRRTLENQNSLGTALPLRCQVHPEKVTYVKRGNDFLAIPEGGCNQKCDADLICGHKCTSLCHILDREHQMSYKCRETCNKKLCDTNPLHVCKRICSVECGPCYYPVPRNLPCGHTVELKCHLDPDQHECTVPVSTTLPCGHIVDKPCHLDVATFTCPHPCEVKLKNCEHACSLTCHVSTDPEHLEYECKKRCARYLEGCTAKTDKHVCQKLCYEKCHSCSVLVRKERTLCSHVFDVPCSLNVDEIQCEKPCTKILVCGHQCKGKCFETCPKCEAKVNKINAICGHAIKVKCSEEPDRKLCKQKCPLMLPCGHPCTQKCNEPCTEFCEEMVDCLKLSPCGHTITKVKCSVANSKDENPKLLLKYCNQPCGGQLKCGHSCSGTCGECHQGRIHQPCREKCGLRLVCGHACESLCGETCPPCDRPFPYKCEHTARFGYFYIGCEEDCTRRCRHQQCTNVCSEICDVPPCTEPCDKKLICGHPCIGFCGDPCPEKCLLCHKKELKEIFFGFEDNKDARFVLLADCGHIIESDGLEGWIDQDDEKVMIKECPTCQTSIINTQRYSDLVKRVMQRVSEARKKFEGTDRENRKRRIVLRNRLIALHTKGRHLLKSCPKLGTLFRTLQNRLEIRNWEEISKIDLTYTESKLEMLEVLLNIKNLGNAEYESEESRHQLNFLMKIFLRQEGGTTEQEISDVQCEMNRLSRIIELSKIKNSSDFSQCLENPKTKTVLDRTEGLLFGWGKFRDEDDEEVERMLRFLRKNNFF